MGRTDESEKIREGFIKGLKDNGYDVYYIGSRNLEVYQIKKGNRKYIASIKVSNLRKGFWGINERVFEVSKECPEKKLGVACFVFLESPKRGYLLTVDELTELKSSLSIDSNRDFKIHKEELDANFPGSWFLDLDDLFEKLESIH